MADTIRTPWILDYLISIAEEYGGDLAAAPCSNQVHKAQLVKFLTFAPPDNAEPCAIWADVSDKKHYIHARLSADAVNAYMQNPLHAGTSVTSCKSGLIKLIQFRLAFARVARRDGGKGMSDNPRLYLHVDEFELLGAFGEPMWGAPVDIAQDANIHEWMVGLRQEGGAGNVLKLKKERTDALAAQQVDKLKAMAAEPHQQTIDAMHYKVQVVRKSASHKSRPSTGAVAPRPIVSKDAIRRSSWKRLRANMIKYVRPPDDVFEQLMVLCDLSADVVPKLGAADPPEKPTGPSQSNSPDQTRLIPHARTPSQWSPSVAGGSRHGCDDGDTSSGTEEEPDDDVSMDAHDISGKDAIGTILEGQTRFFSPEIPMEVDVLSAEASKPPSNLSQSMPPPAQPRTQPPSSSLRSVPYATSPSRGSSPFARERPRDMEALPPSSFPTSSYVLPPSPASSPRFVPATPAYPIPAVRRVPLPQCNPLRRDPDASGEGRVLVENSDTASPGSQRLTQSQSQSQSQTGSHAASQHSGDGSQQSQRPSQLRNQLELHDPTSETPAQTTVDDTHGVDHEKVRADVVESDHESEQIRPRSQQSLSYKGDSQSQGDPPGQAPVPPDSDEHGPVDVASVVSTEEAPVEASHSAPGTNAKEEHSAKGEKRHSSMEPDTANGRNPSPMVVDPGQNTADILIPNAQTTPGWATIVVVGDSDDDSEVDELLSDPLVAAPPDAQPDKKQHNDNGAPSTSHRHTTTSSAGSAKNDEARLESDDERTAGMVDGYMEKVLKLIDARKRSAAREAPLNQADGRTVPVELDRPPVQRARKRERAGRNEATQRSASPQSFVHDPVVWSAPTFMRKTAAKEAAAQAKQPTMKKVKMESASPTKPPDVPREVKSNKRTTGSSLSAEREEPPTKKRKTSTSAVPVFAPETTPPQLQKQSAPSKRDPTSLRNARPVMSKAPPSITIVRSSAPPNAAKASAQKRESAASGSTIHSAPVSAVARNSREVKYVDLRCASRSSSRASSRMSRAQENVSASRTQDRPPSAQPSAKAKGKAVLRPSGSTAAESKAGGDVAGSSLAGVSRAQEASGSAAVSGSRGGSKTSSKVSEGLPADAGLHGGYDVSLELTRTPGGPPLLGWDDLLEIVLKTGRVRYKERQRGT
ncbi:hypothetical protein C8Q78DRAFT_1062230 [Trametes maxima]|nr:hypothetical protein C8Q78DRAFT_1062230 [Trametes maxima]